MAVLVPTTRLATGDNDNRQDGRYSVAAKLITMTVPDLAATITISNVRLNGLIPIIAVASPDIPTDTTFVLNIKDQNGVSVFNDADVADDETIYYDVSTINDLADLAGKTLYLAGLYDVTISFTTPLSGNTATFDVLIIQSSP